MSYPIVHVHTQADAGTSSYVKFMWDTMVALANRPNRMKLTVHCMSAAAIDTIKANLKQVEITLIPQRADGLRGSVGHAVAIEDAMRLIDDGNIHIIADADTVVVAKGWDDAIRTKVLDDNIGCLGTTYEVIGGHTSGNSNVQTYKIVPNFCWFVMSPNYKWAGLNPHPRKDRHVEIVDDRLSKIYNLPIGYRVYCDVGWRVPEFLHDNSIKYEGWDQIKPSNSNRSVVLKGLSDYHEEYHLDGVPFVMHQRGSMSHSYRRDKLSNSFYTQVDAYLLEELRHEPRWNREKLDGSTEPLVIREVVPPVGSTSPVDRKPNEWIKISCNAKMIRAKGSVNKRPTSENVAMTQPVGSMSHLRVEGSLNSPYTINVPPMKGEPYVITCRNATNDEIIVTSGSKFSTTVSAEKTSLLLIDIDGVQTIG